MKTPEETSSISPLMPGLNRVQAVQSLPLLFSRGAGSAPNGRAYFLPLVRVALLDEEGRALLDSTLEWGDVAFLAESLLDLLAQQLEDQKDLMKLRPVAIGAELVEHLDESAAHISKIRELYGHYMTAGKVIEAQGKAPAPQAAPSDPQ